MTGATGLDITFTDHWSLVALRVPQGDPERVERVAGHWSLNTGLTPSSCDSRLNPSVAGMKNAI